MTWSADGTTIEYFDGTEHNWLSNFHEGDPFKWQSTLGHLPGLTTMATGEHAFQAEKARTRLDYVRIATAGDPGRAKGLGRTCELRPDWEEVKYGIMVAVLEAKFPSGSPLADLLMATGDAVLLEGNHWHDQIWGSCVCGRSSCRRQGLNLLGKALTARRCELVLMKGGTQ